MFWSVFYYLGAFTTVWLPYKTRCKTGKNWCKSSCHEVPSEFFATKAPDLTHWTLNSHFGAFRTICVHLGLFGCHTTLSAKRIKLLQKFVPRRLVGILVTNTPDPPHYTLNSCFGVFRIIGVHFGQFGCVTTLSVKQVKLVKNFATSAPDPPHWTLNSCFGAFHTIWVHLGLFFALQHSVQNGSTGATVRATKSRWNFSQRTHPIHPVGH